MVVEKEPRPGGTPWGEMNLREIAGAIKRGLPILAISTLLSTALGLLMALRAEPVYEASVTLRVQDQPPWLAAMNGVSPGLDPNAVGTTIGELRTRSLAAMVVDSLDLAVRVADSWTARLGGRLPMREQVLAEVEAKPGARPSSYGFVRASGGRFVVTDEPTGRRLGSFAPGAAIRLQPDVVVSLARTAREFQSFRLVVQPFWEAVAIVEQTTFLGRPDPFADIILLRFHARDPYLARNGANALAALYLSWRRRLDAAEAERALHILSAQMPDPGTPDERATGPDGLRRTTDVFTRLQTAQIGIILQGERVRVIDPAVAPVYPVRPRRKLTVLLATMIGLVIGSALALSLELFRARAAKAKTKTRSAS